MSDRHAGRRDAETPGGVEQVIAYVRHRADAASTFAISYGPPDRPVDALKLAFHHGQTAALRRLADELELALVGRHPAGAAADGATADRGIEERTVVITQVMGDKDAVIVRQEEADLLVRLFHAMHADLVEWSGATCEAGTVRIAPLPASRLADGGPRVDMRHLLVAELGDRMWASAHDTAAERDAEHLRLLAEHEDDLADGEFGCSTGLILVPRQEGRGHDASPVETDDG